jgi:hypothetical protein
MTFFYCSFIVVEIIMLELLDQDINAFHSEEVSEEF